MRDDLRPEGMKRRRCPLKQKKRLDLAQENRKKEGEKKGGGG